MTDLGTLDSYGMKWMGTVPENWSISPAKRHFYIQLGKMLQNGPEAENDCTVPYLKAVNVLWGRANTEDTPEMWASPDEIMLYGVRDGDLLVCEGGEVGRAGIVRNPPDRCIIQNALHRVRARNSSSVSFLMYVLHSVNSSGWFDVLCNKATIAHFTGQKFAELRVPLPSPKRQRAISTFLDRETSRIDDLIAKKQCQIELLQEKRSALISHVVTKGLDPNVKMKDSGVEWLGEIPEHWKISRVKYVASVVGRIGFRGYTTDDQVDAEEGALTIGATQFNSTGQIDLSSPVYISWEKYYESPEIMVSYNDILVVQRGSTCGKIGFVDRELGPTTINPSVVLLKRIRIVPKYLYYYLSGSFTRSVFDSLLSETAIPMLSQFQIGNIPLCLPPAEEMEIAVEYIDVETARIDRLMERVNTSIHLLREYRTALISAAVTGKIDVREEVA